MCRIITLALQISSDKGLKKIYFCYMLLLLNYITNDNNILVTVTQYAIDIIYFILNKIYYINLDKK